MSDDVAARSARTAYVRWFGERWDAKVCVPERQVRTPESPCSRCHAQVIEGQRGVVLGDAPMHLTCLLAWFGKQQVHVLEEGRAICGFTDANPGDWPEGHSWVSLSHYREATCESCCELVAEAAPVAVEARHGVVMPWPKGWARGPDVKCEWTSGCVRPPVVARYDGLERHAWVYCCLECSKEKKRRSRWLRRS